MAKQVEVKQSSREEKIYPLDFAPSLLEGVTVETIEVPYTSENAIDDPPVISGEIIGNMVYLAVSNLDIGFHRVRCLAHTSNDNLSPEIELLITVKT